MHGSRPVLEEKWVQFRSVEGVPGLDTAEARIVADQTVIDDTEEEISRFPAEARFDEQVGEGDDAAPLSDSDVAVDEHGAHDSQGATGGTGVSFVDLMPMSAQQAGVEARATSLNVLNPHVVNNAHLKDVQHMISSADPDDVRKMIERLSAANEARLTSGGDADDHHDDDDDDDVADDECPEDEEEDGEEDDREDEEDDGEEDEEEEEDEDGEEW